jgi:esterase/lipase superfamily enzyme
MAEHMSRHDIYFFFIRNVAASGNLLVKYVSMDGIPQAFLFFRFDDIILITVHDRFWNVGQANCFLKYFENMVIDHSDL